jgi:hypothetical protein
MKNTQKISNKKRITKAEWLIAAGLILLSLVPMIAGSVRIVELAGGAEITAENARFFASPLPVIIHIISSVLFSIAGAFQFVPSFRHRHLRWHRAAGWLLMPSGLAAALSGLWMTLFYPWPDGDGMLLYAMRLVFGLAMLLAIVFSVTAIQRRDFRTHGDWIIRAYAIGLGAGTQVLTHLPWFILVGGTPDEFSRALMMGAGWIVNIVVAEWIIHRKRGRRTRPKRATSASV